jgi:hypothetical protein
MTYPGVKGCADVEQPNWAAREMAGANFGDQRLNRRLPEGRERLRRLGAWQRATRWKKHESSLTMTVLSTY